MEQSDKTILDSAFTISILVSSRMEGPEGLAAEAAFTIGERLFGMLTEEAAPRPIADVVKEEVDKALLSEEIKNAFASFNTTYESLVFTANSFKIKLKDLATAKAIDNNQFKAFRDDLDKVLDNPESPFLRNINLLIQAGPVDPAVIDVVKEKAFDTWVLGVGIHLSLLKYRIALEEGDMAESRYLIILLQYLDKYITEGWENSRAREYLKLFPSQGDRFKYIGDPVTDDDCYVYDPYQIWNVYNPGNKGILVKFTDGLFTMPDHHYHEFWREYRAYTDRKLDESLRFYKLAQTFNKWIIMLKNYTALLNGDGAEVMALRAKAKEHEPLLMYYENQDLAMKMKFSVSQSCPHWGKVVSGSLWDLTVLAYERRAYGFEYDPKNTWGRLIGEKWYECKEELYTGPGALDFYMMSRVKSS